MWNFFKRFFFLFNAEEAHYLSMDLLSFGIKIPVLSFFLKKSFQFRDKDLECTIDGLHFPNKVGLAAGFDKDGRWLDLLAELGFGFIEIGTITPLPQAGNDKPRLFRLKEDEAVINRMGFNNQGVEALVQRLKKFKNKKKIIVGGNIGKNKLTPAEKAVDDYLFCFVALFHYVDYFVVNVSSPNTPNLRKLQEKGPLTELLTCLQKENASRPQSKPIYLKVAPDLSKDALAEIVEVVNEVKISGIVATNTTITRPNYLKNKNLAAETGGLSGEPLRELSRTVLDQIQSTSNLTIISVGGIMDVQEATYRLSHGADLIQIYTGFIYRGPWFIKSILKELRKQT